MWFKTLTGFSEINPDQVRDNLSVDGNLLTSHVNGKKYVCGVLETPSLAELRSRLMRSEISPGTLCVREILADAQQLHADECNAGALFQVASQFNLLEMISPDITPEDGVDGYEHDFTQGPACAIAAGAGTIYRNYLVEINGQKGQSADNQIDCLHDIGVALANLDPGNLDSDNLDSDNLNQDHSGHHLWEMKNGYALATKNGLNEITDRLNAASESEMDNLRSLLRIGLHWNTEVTIADSHHTVSQAYCSALPVAYSNHSPDRWQRFAQLVLEASYEAVICAGILNYRETGNATVYLTLIGGGAFGNDSQWIMSALYYALKRYKYMPLDVVIVSRRRSNVHVQDLIQQLIA